jgi:hypothetical protein
VKLRISTAGASFEVVLRETPTAKAIVDAAPFEARAQTWGEEVYFSTPVRAKLEADAKQIVEPGTVCFWTEGDALALPYGRTPLSSDSRPKLASRCNVVGKIEGDVRALARVKAGEKITVTAA